MYWDPFEEIRRIQRELDRMFAGLSQMTAYRFREPLVDILDEGDKFRIVVDLPGLRKEDIDVIVQPESVTIKAERKIAEEKSGKNYYVRERAVTSFYRVITLPEPVIPEETKAKYNNGVLEIELKKAGKEEKGYRVKVE